MLFVAQAGWVAKITRPLAIMEQMAERHSSARAFLPLAVKAAKAGKKAITLAVLAVTEALVEAAATAVEETAVTVDPSAVAAVALVAWRNTLLLVKPLKVLLGKLYHLPSVAVVLVAALVPAVVQAVNQNFKTSLQMVVRVVSITILSQAQVELVAQVVQQVVETLGTQQEIVVVLVVALIVAVLAEHHYGMDMVPVGKVDSTQVEAVLPAVST